VNDEKQQSEPTINRSWVPWLVLLAGFCVNVYFWEIQPTVWLDDISYSDPAVNWIEGRGFVSSAWYAQDATAFWSGNVPLHQFLLAGWLKITGFSEFKIRFWGYLQGIFALALFYSAASRLMDFKGMRGPILMLSFLLLADGISFSYRSGRSDALTMLLASLQFWASTLSLGRFRTRILFVAGLLTPWAGLQLVVYQILAWGAVCGLAPERYWKPALSVAVGTLAGGIALVLWYAGHGTLIDFWSSISRHSAAGGAAKVSLNDLWAAIFVDRSSIFLVFGALVLAMWSFADVGGKKSREFAVGALLVLIVLPAAMRLAGTYKLYYSWMTLIPAGVLLIAAIQHCSRRRVRAVCVGILILAMLVGLPGRLFLSTLASSASLKQKAEQAVLRNIRDEDKAICHSKFYYLVRNKVAQAYFPSYLQRMTPRESSEVQVMILDPEDGPWPPWESRDNWVEVERIPADDFSWLPDLPRKALQRYSHREINLPWDLVIYRRKSPAGNFL